MISSHHYSPLTLSSFQSAAMEDLIAQFTIFSHQALTDKTFDPSTIEDLMKLFEVESYKAWAAAELEQDREVERAEIRLQEAESYLDSVMESAMDEFRRFEEEFDRMAADEMRSLEEIGESARRLGRVMEKSASIASKKYVEAAAGSATAAMKSAFRGAKSLSSSAGKKVHPSS
uniref:Maternal effect embryo arrest 9 n=1 Tax=Kalanchoe fedtschenkoi TaxID=63787 RepID=A0A7N0T4L3_KALFE